MPSPLRRAACLALTSTLMAATLTLPVFCVEPDYLKAGMNEYYKGHYNLARAQLEEAIKLNSKNQLAHYFLAQTLAETHDSKGALEEYKICHQLDPKSSCGLKAKQGIEQYQSLHQSNAQKAFSSIRQDRRAGATDRISTQIDKNVENSLESSKAQSKKIMDEAQKEVERLKTQAQNDIDSLPHLRRNGYWRSQMRLQIQEQSKDRIKDVMDRAKSQAKQLEKDTESKVDTLHSLKQGFNSGLNSASKKGTNIAPEGTNVYVRNYEHKK
ncbi:MAG: hypothetical protein IPG59_02755 [Candidatus Melainabacteria bacterium]|nr:MAG: hypothetical protein IPG59_02755 [Candidatus Melainabacteria bacterium]